MTILFTEEYKIAGPSRPGKRRATVFIDGRCIRAVTEVEGLYGSVVELSTGVKINVTSMPRTVIWHAAKCAEILAAGEVAPLSMESLTPEAAAVLAAAVVYCDTSRHYEFDCRCDDEHCACYNAAATARSGINAAVRAYKAVTA